MASRKRSSPRISTVASALPEGLEVRDPQLARHASAGQQAAAQRPHNAGKPSEYPTAGEAPELPGEHSAVDHDDAAGTLSEINDTVKTGTADALVESTRDVGNFAHHRVLPAAVALTTNQGVSIADNQSSSKAGLRGPTILADFILREKITHFDHERIPERVVHARGSGAHGFMDARRPDVHCS